MLYNVVLVSAVQWSESTTCIYMQPWTQKTLAPWKKSYDKLRQRIKNQRHYFVLKGLSGQSYGFSSSHVWMCELDYKESWVPKIVAFKLWCWRRLLRASWTAVRSNQSTPKEISPEFSLEELMLERQYFGHLMLWKIEGRMRRRWQRMRWLDGITNSMDMSFSKLLGVGDGQGSLACCGRWGRKQSDRTERLNWTEL